MRTDTAPRRELGRSPVERKHLLFTVRAVVSGLLIAWILRDLAIGDILGAVRTADPILVALAFCIPPGGVLIASARWRILLAAQGVASHLTYLIESFMVGVFFSNLLPSTIGGDSYRAYDSWRLGTSKTASVVVMVVDRFLGIVALLFLALLALSLSPRAAELIPLPYVAMLAAMLVSLSLLWIVFSSTRFGFIASSRKGMRLLEPVVAAFAPFAGKTAALAKAFGLSVLLQVNVVFFYYVVAKAMGFAVPLVDFFLLVPAALLVMAIPISVNGIGLRESVFTYLLGMYGVGPARAVGFAWIAYSVVLVLGLVGGVVYALRKEVERPRTDGVGSPVGPSSVGAAAMDRP